MGCGGYAGAGSHRTTETVNEQVSCAGPGPPGGGADRTRVRGGGKPQPRGQGAQVFVLWVPPVIVSGLLGREVHPPPRVSGLPKTLATQPKEVLLRRTTGAGDGNADGVWKDTSNFCSVSIRYFLPVQHPCSTQFPLEASPLPSCVVLMPLSVSGSHPHRQDQAWSCDPNPANQTVSWDSAEEGKSI